MRARSSTKEDERQEALRAVATWIEEKPDNCHIVLRGSETTSIIVDLLDPLSSEGPAVVATAKAATAPPPSVRGASRNGGRDERRVRDFLEELIYTGLWWSLLS